MTALTVIFAGLALAGCREQEQNRPLFYEKGKYSGGPVEGIKDEALEDARQRAWNQRGF